MNHDKLTSAVPAALLFAGAFSAFSSSTTTLPGPAGAAHALEPNQNRRIAQAGPRASEEDEEDLALFISVVETGGCSSEYMLSSCCIDVAEADGAVYTAC